MKEWHIQITDQADRDMRDIYEYIAFQLQEPITAEKLIERIRNGIYGLKTSPKSFAVYPNEPWKSQGLRRINVGNYGIFFVPIESSGIVAIVRIMYGGRDIEMHLNQTQE